MVVNGGGGCFVLRELTAPTPASAGRFSLKGVPILPSLDGSVCLTESPVKRNLLCFTVPVILNA